MDWLRLLRNLIFFFLGVLIPMLAFQSAYADFWVTTRKYPSGEQWCEKLRTPAFQTITGLDPANYPADLYSWGYRFGSREVTHYGGGTNTRYNVATYIASPGSCESMGYDTSGDPFYVAPEPDHCLNAVQDGDETGVNCGGSCASVCDSWACEEGWTPAGDGCIPEDETILLTSTDQLGECPEGTVKIDHPDGDFYFGDCTAPEYLTDDNGSCQEGYSLVGSTTYGVPLCGPNSLIYSSDDPIPDYDYTAPDVNDFEPGSLSIVKDESTQTTDNQDGTSTVVTTTTETKTDQSGRSYTTTTTQTDTVDNSTGSILTTNTTINQQTPVEDNPENYQRNNTVPGPNVYDSSLEGLLPEKRNVFDVVKGYADQLPIMSVLDQVSIDSELTECRVETAELPWGFTFSVNCCHWEPYLRTMGSILLIVAQISALWIVIGGLRK